MRDGASDEAALDGRREAVDLPADDGTGRFGGAGGAALRDERQPDFQMAARENGGAKLVHGSGGVMRLRAA